MGSTEFQFVARHLVMEYENDRIDKTNEIKAISMEDVYVVWFGYILGGQKCLVSTTLPDGMYFEITYDKTREKMYFDAYKKWDHAELDTKQE